MAGSMGASGGGGAALLTPQIQVADLATARHASEDAACAGVVSATSLAPRLEGGRLLDRSVAFSPAPRKWASPPASVPHPPLAQLIVADLQDSPEQDLVVSVLDSCCAFIHDALSSHLSHQPYVLVHCAHGKSRSVALGVGSLMLRFRLPLLPLLRLAHGRRPVADINDGFLTQLALLGQLTAPGSAAAVAEATPAWPWAGGHGAAALRTLSLAAARIAIGRRVCGFDSIVRAGGDASTPTPTGGGYGYGAAASPSMASRGAGSGASSRCVGPRIFIPGCGPPLAAAAATTFAPSPLTLRRPVEAATDGGERGAGSAGSSGAASAASSRTGTPHGLPRHPAASSSAASSAVPSPAASQPLAGGIGVDSPGQSWTRPSPLSCLPCVSRGGFACCRMVELLEAADEEAAAGDVAAAWRAPAGSDVTIDAATVRRRGTASSCLSDASCVGGGEAGTTGTSTDDVAARETGRSGGGADKAHAAGSAAEIALAASDARWAAITADWLSSSPSDALPAAGVRADGKGAAVTAASGSTESLDSRGDGTFCDDDLAAMPSDGSPAAVDAGSPLEARPPATPLHVTCLLTRPSLACDSCRSHALAINTPHTAYSCRSCHAVLFSDVNIVRDCGLGSRDAGPVGDGAGAASAAAIVDPAPFDAAAHAERLVPLTHGSADSLPSLASAMSAGSASRASLASTLEEGEGGGSATSDITLLVSSAAPEAAATAPARRLCPTIFVEPMCWAANAATTTGLHAPVSTPLPLLAGCKPAHIALPSPLAGLPRSSAPSGTSLGPEQSADHGGVSMAAGAGGRRVPVLASPATAERAVVMCSEGKLTCPCCESKLGTFSWTGGRYPCPCGALAPGVMPVFAVDRDAVRGEALR